MYVMKGRSHITYAWILIICLSISSELCAQATFKFQKLSITDGLSQNSVTTVFQDSYGFIWLGTHDGLNRYDGYDFKHYRHGDDDSLTIADTFVLAVDEDVNGNIWFGDRLGFHFLDRKTERIVPFYIDSLGTFNPNNQSNLIVSDPEGGIWIGTSIGLYRIKNSDLPKLTTDSPDKISLFEKLDDQVPVSILIDGQYVWILNSRGLTLYQKTGDGDISKLNFWEVTGYVYSKLFKDSSGDVWLNTETEIYKVSDKQNLVKANRLPAFPKITAFHHDISGKLWVGTSNGLFIADKQDGLLASIYHDQDDRFSLGDNYVYSIGEDAAGLIWIGLANGGVNIYDPSTNNFKRLTSETDNEFALTNNLVWSMLEDSKGNLWIGTSKGLNRFERKDPGQALTDKLSIQENFTSVKRYYAGKKSGLRTDFIRTLLEDSEGNIWAGTGTDVQIYDTSNDSFMKLEEYLSLENSSGIHSVTYLLEDSEGLVWIATSSGLFVVNKSDSSVKKVEQSYGSKNKLWTTYIMSVFEKADGNMLIGTNVGFAEWDRDQGTYTTHENGDDTFESAFVTGFAEDGEGNIWLSTMGSGMVRYNATENSYTTFSTEHGLANSVVYSLLLDGVGNIWMSTNEGISKFDIQNEVYENYSVNDGIASAEHGQNSFFANQNGELFFGGITGATIFNPGSIIQSEYAPTAAITDIMVNYIPMSNEEKRKLPTSFSGLKNIVLTPAEKVVSFEFSGFDFRGAQQSQYAFRLVNFKDEWIYTDADQRIAQYTNLDPGSYVFEVKAANNHGIWNENKATLNVTVLPPFWATWWFRLTSGAILFVIVGAVVRYVSTRKLKVELRKLEVARKIQDERERISRDLHDHVGSQLANLISGLDLVDTYAEHSDNDKARELLVSLKDEAQLTIKQLRDTIWALHQGGITVDQFDEHIRSYVSNQRKVSESLEVHFKTNISHSYELTATQALNLFRIVQEAIHNIVKHSGGKNMFITLQCTNDEFKIDVTDDGEFKEREETKESYGLSNMHERAKELGAVFSLEKNNGSGTSVAISLPLAGV